MEQASPITEPEVCKNFDHIYPFGQTCVTCAIHNDSYNLLTNESVSDAITHHITQDELTNS